MACFAFDSSEIRPALYTALDRLAKTVVSYDKTILHIVGHTDSVGEDDYNRALSIRRAQGVAQYLMLKGVATERLRIDGRGETDPRRPNDTAAHRALNRRVEIHIRPVIEGDEQRALVPSWACLKSYFFKVSDIIFTRKQLVCEIQRTNKQDY